VDKYWIVFVARWVCSRAYFFIDLKELAASS